MAYNVIGTLNYSSSTNRTTALNAINAVLATYDYTNLSGTPYTPGVNTSGTLALTFAIQIPDNQVEAFRADFLTAWKSGGRSSGAQNVMVVKA